MNTITLNIGKDFSLYPGLRTYDISERTSGEVFYHEFLNPNFYKAIQEKKHLKVVLDGTMGYTPSFIDEAFGRLVFDFGETLVQQMLEVESNEEPSWKNQINNKTIPEWEKRRKANDAPVNTESYNVPEWWHMDNAGKMSLISSYHGRK